MGKPNVRVTSRHLGTNGGWGRMGKRCGQSRECPLDVVFAFQLPERITHDCLHEPVNIVCPPCGIDADERVASEGAQQIAHRQVVVVPNGIRD
jgi:hypothetical protein